MKPAVEEQRVGERRPRLSVLAIVALVRAFLNGPVVGVGIMLLLAVCLGLVWRKVGS